MEEEQICKSAKTQVKRTIISGILTILIIAISIIIALNIKFYDKPKEDKAAKEGIPTIEEQYEYSTLVINDGYEIGLCGKPKIEEDKINLYITNMEQNEVWLKAEILNEEEKIIGQTGIIKPNQYVQSIEIEEKIEGTVNIKIVEYEIDTYRSKGSVNLKI